jgi:nitrate reductase NapAB chaperone NapD
LILIDPIYTQRDINGLIVVVEASSSDELLDEARSIQMKPAISSLNVNTKEVFKRVTLLDDDLYLRPMQS